MHYRLNDLSKKVYEKSRKICKQNSTLHEFCVKWKKFIFKFWNARTSQNKVKKDRKIEMEQKCYSKYFFGIDVA